jgi:hypothetical protein
MTGQPLEGAIVTLGDAVARTEANGAFQIRGTGLQLSARAYGYQRARVDLAGRENGLQEIGLKPFAPKALYLSFYGIGDRGLRDSALQLIETTELNALVIDVKGDRGGIPYKSAIPLSAQVRAQEVITSRDLEGMLRSLRAKEIYTIARIVVFKDDLLASARHDLAVKLPSGTIWHDREGLA